MSITLYHHDIPESFVRSQGVLALDTEAMGLEPFRDRLCVVQMSWGDGQCALVQFFPGAQPEATNLKTMLANPQIEKLFHFGRFDMALMLRTFGVRCQPVYCTKIASRLARTYTDRHGLKDLCQELLGVGLSKSEQSSDWGRDVLSPEQKKYAAGDVLHLHALRKKLDIILKRENRLRLAQQCFQALQTRVDLDVAGFADDIFRHV